MQKGCELAENYRSFDMIQQTACVGRAQAPTIKNAHVYTECRQEKGWIDTFYTTHRSAGIRAKR